MRGQVLRDPRQKRFFKARDIHDLFTLGSQVCAYVGLPPCCSNKP